MGDVPLSVQIQKLTESDPQRVLFREIFEHIERSLRHLSPKDFGHCRITRSGHFAPHGYFDFVVRARRDNWQDDTTWIKFKAASLNMRRVYSI